MATPAEHNLPTSFDVHILDIHRGNIQGPLLLSCLPAGALDLRNGHRAHETRSLTCTGARVPVYFLARAPKQSLDEKTVHDTASGYGRLDSILYIASGLHCKEDIR